MTRILLMAGLLLTGTVTFNEARADVEINSKNFPDETFRKFVKDTKAINPDGSSKLTAQELQAVTTMDVSNRKIANLTGIEYFTNLTTLKCANCNLQELLLSNFEKLETLDCHHNSNLYKLEVKDCKNLKTLVCNDCALTGLTFSNAKNLQYLRCYNNSLKNLNLSGCTALKEVVCYQNKLRGNYMTDFINNLPTTTNEALLYVCKDENSSTGNQVTYEQAQAAKAKNWTLMKYITDSWALYAGNNIPIDVTIFPDEYLLNFAQDKVDKDKNNVLSDEEVESVTTILTDWGLDIRDFSCLRLFTQLTTLRCENCKLTGIDLSANKKLKSLSLQDNLLTSIDLSNNTELENLNCSYNNIPSLDLSNNKALKTLSCVQNGLTELDLSANTQLEFLECFNNHLQGDYADIFISKLPDRKDTTSGVIYFYRKEPPGYNSLTSVQLENIKAKNWNAKQYYYDGFDDHWVDFVPNHTGIYIDEKTFPDTYFRRYVGEFDNNTDGYLSDEEVAAVKTIGSTPRISYLFRDFESLQGIEFFTQLETLDLSGNEKITSFDASVCPQLKTLNCTNRVLTSLNVSGCTELTSLSCSSNKLTSINGLSSCTKLTKLYCYKNPLESLDLSNCPNLAVLDCTSTPLTSLNLPNRTSLTRLYCGGKDTPLTTLDVSGCTNLETLSCYDSPLTTLNVSGCTQLVELGCSRNQLTSLDVSGCTKLKNLYCYNNQLTSLDVSGCTQLNYINCENNQLTSLKLSGLTSLIGCTCQDNQLTSLEISDCESLKWITCYSNPLVTVKVTNCTGMTSLSFANLQLASIEVSGCPSLNNVYLPGNRIRGKAMDELIEALPVIETTNPDEMGYFYCINMHQSDEQSRITTAQAARLKAKGWRVWAYCYLYNGRSYDYDGHGTGDVDGNGIVDADDVNMTVSHILGLQETGTDSRAQEEQTEAPEFFPIAADVTGDGEVDITDLTQIISKVGTVVYSK